MSRRIHLLWPVLIALTVGACSRQQPAYYVDSVTGQPVAMSPMPQMAHQPQPTVAHSQQPSERGLFNTFYSQRPAQQPYQAPVYAQQTQPSYQQPSYTAPAYKPAQQVAQAQVYAQPQTYAQPQPAPQYYQPYAGGPYAAAPQANPYAQARWY